MFTNLSRDHLDYHGSLQRYAAAKRKLFQRNLRVAVVNVDDAVGAAIAKDLPATVQGPRVRPRRHGGLSDIDYGQDGILRRLAYPLGRWRVQAAALLRRILRLQRRRDAGGLLRVGQADRGSGRRHAKLVGVPGRMQRVAENPTVIVDYAHTPDGLRSMLAATRSHLGDGRLIVVFGCGGDRDRGKRAEMAQAAEAGADVVIVTSDNPRSEDPQRIVDEVVAGFRPPQAARCIVDRRSAIHAALQCANADDIVVVAGKGHEETQQIGGEKLPFRDVDVVREWTVQARPQRCVSSLRNEPDGGD